MPQKSGFTFIELLITLVVISIAFLPLMRMFAVGLEQVYESSDIATARYLAQAGMEKVRNLGFTQAQLEESGVMWEPLLSESPLEVNGRLWRVERRPFVGTDPLEIHVLVWQIDEKTGRVRNNKPAAALVTMMEDLDWAPAI